MKSVMPDIPNVAADSLKISTQPGKIKESLIWQAFRMHRAPPSRSRQRKKLQPGSFRTPEPTAARRMKAFSKKSFPVLTGRQKTSSGGPLNIHARGWKGSCEKKQGL